MCSCQHLVAGRPASMVPVKNVVMNKPIAGQGSLVNERNLSTMHQSEGLCALETSRRKIFYWAPTAPVATATFSPNGS